MGFSSALLATVGFTRGIRTSLGGAGDDAGEPLGGLVHVVEAGEHVHGGDGIVVLVPLLRSGILPGQCWAFRK